MTNKFFKNQRMCFSMKKNKLIHCIIILLSISLFSYPIITLAMRENMRVDVTVDEKENAIDLEWSEPSRNEPYTYQLFQKKGDMTEFQAISTVDLDNGSTVRALNIFPSNHVTERNIIPEKGTGEVDLAGKPLLKSAMLKDWIGEYGKDRIYVDAINQEDFNNDPDKYLRDSSGNYDYDVVVVGFWNLNSAQYQFLGDNGVEALREFAETGRGLLTGHHHIALRELDKGMNKLKDLFGVKFVGEEGWNQYQSTYYDEPVEMDYVGPEESESAHDSRYWSEGDQLIATRTGLLLEYPNYIAEEGRVFDVPKTHNGGDFMIGDTWVEFKDPVAKGYPDQEPVHLTELPDGTKGTNRAYL